LSRKIKKALKRAFNAPTPTRKADFLVSFKYPRASRINFMTAQAGYIRKRVWIMSFLMIVAVLIGLRYQEDTSMVIWIASSFLPFFVLLGITEIAKSVSYHMAELEMSCRYSLSDITLARLVIIGVGNTFTFIFLTALLSQVSGMGIFTFSTHMFTPYLMACSLSLFSLNRFRGRERLYICGGASCLVSIASIAILNPYNAIYISQNRLFGVFVFLFLWTVGEAIKFIRKMEDNQWNLSLTA